MLGNLNVIRPELNLRFISREERFVKYFLLLSLFVLFSSAGLGGVNSVDNISFRSNNDFFNGTMFVVDFTGNDQTDKVNVFLDAEKFESKVDGRSVEQNVRIESDPGFTRASFGFRDTGRRPLRKVDAVSFFVDTNAYQDRKDIISFLNDSSMVKSKCIDLNGDNRITNDSDFVFRPDIFRMWNFETKVYCYSGAEQLASIGEINSNPSVVFSTEFTVSNGEKILRKNITNNDLGMGASSQIGKDVRIQWNGNMGTGKNSPTPTDELIAHSNSNDWRIVERHKYKNYIEEVRSSHSKLRDWKKGFSSAEDIEMTINQAATAAFEKHSNTEFDEGYFTGSNIQNGKLSLEIDSLRYPKFSIYLNACDTNPGCDAFIEVGKSAGEPKITHFSKTSVPELDHGEITANIKNMGEFEGSFMGRAKSCEGGFSPIGVAKIINLKPNESANVTFNIGFSSNSLEKKQISGSCVIEVKDQVSDIVDVENVTLRGIQQKECIVGEVFVENSEGRDQLRKCGEQGIKSHIVEVCESDEKAEVKSGEYQCQSKNEEVSSNNSSIFLETFKKAANKLFPFGSEGAQLKPPKAVKEGLEILHKVNDYIKWLSNIPETLKLKEVIIKMALGLFATFGTLYITFRLFTMRIRNSKY